MFVSQLDRILSTPGGCALIAGRSGIGRRICINLVSHMLRLELYTPYINREYSTREFKKDLKFIME
jgi:dynein heavy chain 2